MSPRLWNIVQVAMVAMIVVSVLTGVSASTPAIMFAVAVVGEDVAKMREEQAQRMGKERING